MKKWIVLILVLTVLVLAGCGTDGGKLDSVGGVNQDSVELTEEMEAMLQEMGISLEKFATYSPEQQQAILGELGIVAGDREEQSTRPTGEKYTTADVAAGGKYMVYIGDDLGWNSYRLYYEDGKLVKVETSFRKNSEEEPDETLYAGDTLKEFPYIDKSLDELIDYFDQNDYDYKTRIEATK